MFRQAFLGTICCNLVRCVFIFVQRNIDAIFDCCIEAIICVADLKSRVFFKAKRRPKCLCDATFKIGSIQFVIAGATVPLERRVICFAVKSFLNHT
jgi:hypothetical protein